MTHIAQRWPARDRWFRMRLAAAVSGVAIAVTGTSAAIAAAGNRPAQPATTLAAQIKVDKAFISAKYHHCVVLHLTPVHCPFAVAATPLSRGGHLIAVDLTQFTGDDCLRGLTFFFDGTHFLVSTHKLRPFSLGGVKNVSADGTAKIAVIYWVNRSRLTTCAMSGNGGTDRYVYRFNGTRMVKLSGTPPRLPKVIVGT